MSCMKEIHSVFDVWVSYYSLAAEKHAFWNTRDVVKADCIITTEEQREKTPE
jgi:hypothetical protein